MSLICNTAEAQVFQCVNSAMQAAIKDGALPEAELPAFKVEIPADRGHGDYSSNAALMGARVFRMAPPKIAEAIINHIDLSDTYFCSCEALSGFLNFTLSPDYYSDILKDVTNKAENYGHSDFAKGKKALVEFVSANPTGPMHVGNARGGAIGDSLAEVLSWAGYYVEREFYINDAGNQIQKFALSLDIRYLQLFDSSYEMPEDSYHGQDIIDHARAFADIYSDSFVSKSEEERREALVNFALPKNIKGLEDDLLKYRIKYDTWFRESSLHANGEVQRVIDLLKSTDNTYESEGALWFKAEKYGCPKDFVIVRSNGIPTYIVPDIAYHYNKLATRGFDLAIDVLGADHHGYVGRLAAALTALGVDASKLKIVLMQMVRLVNKDGEVIKASKRSGKAITLVSLLDEVSIDAARFIFNFREANTHCDFNLDLAVEQSSKNPVYYCQYAHARICSILKNKGADGIDYLSADNYELNLLVAEEEKELIRHIAGLTGEIISAAKELDSAKLTKYAYDLAALFHKFYNACRCDVEDEQLKKARLYLCNATKIVLANVLKLLKIEAPENM